MRYHEIISETIVSGSRRLGFFLTKRLKEIDEIIAASDAANAVIKAGLRAKNDAEYLVQYALRKVSDGYVPNEYDTNLVKHYNLENLRDSIESILKFGSDRFLRYAVDNLKYIEPVSDETRTALAFMPSVEQGILEYGFEPDDPDPDYQAAMQLVNAYLVIAKNLKRVETVIEALKPVFADTEKRHAYDTRPREYRPDHGEVETLYHASMYASEIVRNGFAAEKPEDRKGVGNLGTQATISFTHDIKIAHDIMRALREIWMIVHGQLTRRDIIKWLKAENIDLKKAQSFYMTSREEPNSIGNTIALYRAYLGLSRIRTDPVFISPQELIPHLVKIDIKDIGIVSCPVKLDGDDVEYLHGEAEFRVPASRVVGAIKRVA